MDKQGEKREEEEEEEEKDLSIPGSSYMKLMALTPASVQPGNVQNSTHAEVKIGAIVLGQCSSKHFSVFMLGS